MKKFLTYAPTTQRLRSGEWAELSILGYGTLDQLTFRVKCYRIAGTTATYNYTASMVGGRSTFVVGIPPSETFALLSKMEVWLIYGGVQVSDTYTYIIDQRPLRDPVRIAWINTLGGVDSYTFTGAKTGTTIAEKTAFVRDLPVGFSVSNRGESVASVETRDEVDVISDFETRDAMRWLGGIIQSSEVWVIENGVIIPVVILTNSHVTDTDDLVQFKLKYRKANNTIVQHG